MPLHYYYGTMASGKTASLLMAIHQYQTTGKRVMLLKPAVDDRSGADTVGSRVPGLGRAADLIWNSDSAPSTRELSLLELCDAVFVDECQFLSPTQVGYLFRLSFKTAVMCYGLRTDFRGHLFPGAATLFALAHSITELPSVCHHCSDKAIFNQRLGENQSLIDIGGDDKYLAVCAQCFGGLGHTPDNGVSTAVTKLLPSTSDLPVLGAKDATL
jgi:thymidine kinase